MFNMYKQMSKSSKIGLWSIVAILLLGIIVLVFIAVNVKNYSYSEVGAQGAASGRSQIIGETLYLYNGVGFYSAPVDNPRGITLLARSGKLPEPDSVIWVGNKGVVLSFSGSFLKTPVAKQDPGYSSRINSTWYFDFKTNSIIKISEKKPYNSIGYYSSDRDQVYFFTKNPELSFTDEVVSFSPETKAVKSITSFASQTEGVAITPCETQSKTVCVGTRTYGDVNTSQILSVSETLSTKEIISFDGLLTQTNNSNTFLLFDASDRIGLGVDSVTPPQFKNVRIFNTSRNSYINLASIVTPTSIAGGVFNESPSIFTLENGGYTTISNGIFGKSQYNGNLNLSEEQTYIPTDHQMATNYLQFFDTMGRLWVLSPSGFSTITSSDDVTNAEAVIKECFNGDYNLDRQKRSVELLLIDNESFDSEVSKISECLTKKDASIYLDYVFTAYSETNGKITTD